jgi:hypothetical protein
MDTVGSSQRSLSHFGISDIIPGMARIFTCAPGVAQIVQGKAWSETGLPECFQMTNERLLKLSGGATESVW